MRDTEHLALIVLSLVLVLCSVFAVFGAFHYGDPGTHDFIEYWTAYRAALDGMNPYAPDVVEPLQAGLGRAGEPLMYWAPPWLLPLLAPILELPFETAARIWFVCNVVFLLVASTVAAHLYCPKRRWLAALIGVISIPAVHCLYVGQISLLLAMGVALFLAGIEKDRVIIGGVGLALLTVKPHLFLLLALFIGWRAVKRRSFLLPASGAGWLVVLCVVTLVFMPHSLGAWFETLRLDPAGATSRLAWKTTTIASLLRDAFPATQEALGNWLLLLVPTGAALMLGIWLRADDPSKTTADRGIMHAVLPASLSFAPFGWFFDSSVLVPTQVALSTAGDNDPDSARLKPGLVFPLLLVQVLAVTSVLYGLNHHQLVWFPLSMLAIAVVRIMLKRQIGPSSCSPHTRVPSP